MQELILFPNYKAKNNYLKDTFKSYTLNTDNYKTLHLFYKDSLDNFISKYKINNPKELINEEIAIINIHNALSQYVSINKNSLLAKQNITYELGYAVYQLIEEITFAEFYNADFKNNNSLKEVKEVIEVINIYKQINIENNLLDEFDSFKLFIDAVKNKELNGFEEIKNITIYNFEKVPPIHLIFLENLNKYYNINIKAVMPYNMKDFFDNKYKLFYHGINNFEVNEISNFSNCLINKNKNIKKYKDSIKFISGFGIKQEVHTVVDEVIKLIKNGTALYDIGIVFSDIQKYNDVIINRLKECSIPFDERRSDFIWKVPIIPVLTSIFLILDKYNGEIDVDILIKILSSSYINNLDGINPYHIRDLIYENNYIEIFSKMSLKDFKNKISNKFKNNKSAVNTIIEFTDLLNELVSKKTYKEIGTVYINILKFLKIHTIFDDNNIKSIYKLEISENEYNKNEYYNRDFEALKAFIDFIIQVSNSQENEEEISHFDFYTALNVLLREKYLRAKGNKSLSLTISNLFDARGLRFKHLFILGMNNDFIDKKPNTFFMNNKLREEINKKCSKQALITQSFLSDCYYALFLNIISSCYDNSNIYFSFRLKDENGNLEVPFYYLEDLYNELYNEDFNFENLKKNGLIYREDYIQRASNVHTEKENAMSLFFYNDIIYKLNNLDELISTVNHKANKNGYINFDDKHEEIKKFFRRVFEDYTSVTTLEAVMECPAKFFYSNLFERNSVESNIKGINYMQKGIIYHNFFQNFYKKVKLSYDNNNSLDCYLKEDEFNNYNDIAKEVIEEYMQKFSDLYLERDLDERYTLEHNLDKEVIKEEGFNIMTSFIKNEIKVNEEKFEKENYYYVPFNFEEKIEEDENNSIIYKDNDFIVRIKGRIDRIDFSYDKESGKINGVRIVDYKGSSSNKYNKKEENISEIIKTYFQPILYLKYVLNKYIEGNIEEEIKNCEVVFSIYKEKDIINKPKDAYQFYDNREVLLSICGYIKSDYNLENYLKEIFDKILNGELIYTPSENACANCYNASFCDASLKTEDE